jgi:Predicted transcriptional regulators
MKEQDIISTLQKLGLTYYEAKSYYTLLETGVTNPTAIAEESGVPRTKIYEVLKKLEKNKWIKIEKTRPSTVKPRYPKEVLEEHKVKFNSELDNIAKELSMIHDNMLEEDIPKIRVIRSPEKIIQITEEVMENAKNKINVMGSLYLPNGIEIMKDQISKAKQRGVNVRIISKQFKKELSDTNLSAGKNIIGNACYVKNIIIDDKEIIVMLTEIENCIPNMDSVTILWITSPVLAAYISSIFEMEWENLGHC